MTTQGAQHEDILVTVSGIIREVIGEQWVHDLTITPTTSFSFDLEVESIEIVALAEKLQEHYGSAVDFPRWLSEMELDQIINLTVGQLVEFIVACQS